MPVSPGSLPLTRGYFLTRLRRFKRHQRQLAKASGLPSSGRGATLDQIIDSLPNFGPVNAVRKGKWKMIKDARNAFIHCGIMPGPKERAILIEEVLQLEKDLEKEVVEKRLSAHA